MMATSGIEDQIMKLKPKFRLKSLKKLARPKKLDPEVEKGTNRRRLMCRCRPWYFRSEKITQSKVVDSGCPQLYPRER
jgi:hypothetical protein